MKKKRDGSARPPKTVKTKFIRVLEKWQSVRVQVKTGKHTMHILEYIVAPTKKVYRRALSWENPSLVIDSPILPNEHAIRLRRVKDKAIIKEAHHALRRN